VIDVRLLVVLRAIAVQGSVTGAARALSYSPSAVSQQLARLERELGVELVHRHGRRITMTAHGRELADRAAALIELADDVEARATQAGRMAGNRALLRISAFPQSVRWLLAPALAAGRDEIRDMAVDVTVCAPDAAARDVRHGLADLALVYQASSPAATPHARTLGTARLQLVTADGRYPAPRLADCAALPWVLPAPGTPCAVLVERAFARVDIRPRVVATATSLDGVAALVGAGLGVSLLPQFALNAAAGPSALVSRTLTDVDAALHLCALLSPNSAHPDVVDALVAEMARLVTPDAGTAAIPASRTEPECYPAG
jgi:DNA-binding transcriptional LysR family regulator